MAINTQRRSLNHPIPCPAMVTLSQARIDDEANAISAKTKTARRDWQLASKSDFRPHKSNQEGDHGFHALSYEWGREGDLGSHIFINGFLEPGPIRRNLEVALRTIRDKEFDKTLWVDSICINQQDSAERSHQVDMMGRIFKRSQWVIVWLGPESDGSDTAMDMIRDTRKLETRIIWVIQELFLARYCEIRCGSEIITREQFNDFITCMNRPGTQFEQSTWVKERAGNPAEAHRLAQQFKWAGMAGKRVNTLRTWLRRSYNSSFEATDKRDLVYALIRASEDIDQDHSVVSYEGTVRQAFLQAVPLVRRDISPWSPVVAQSQALFLLQYAERMGLPVDDDLRRDFFEVMREQSDPTPSDLCQ
ncbi:heterokaryon incompatibility protein-domain-containing protein [Cercophora newfieldiana]|uniref:Heterokaryon incompatibility protein-domain-containing protein n=1 Tax=Cercophora newfieldiana TaxID=92897 RepID=A0AA39XY13_9PEZI|nr:heterokaryon incompatibility protein-domain-containing protein [Cercophora newfieldiana]